MAMVATMVDTAGTRIAGYIVAGTSAAIEAGRTRGIATFHGNLRHALKAPHDQAVGEVAGKSGRMAASAAAR
jgi:hypothetical protein